MLKRGGVAIPGFRPGSCHAPPSPDGSVQEPSHPARAVPFLLRIAPYGPALISFSSSPCRRVPPSVRYLLYRRLVGHHALLDSWWGVAFDTAKQWLL